MEPTPGSSELELIGKVELRIALADDEKLSKLLDVYLAPLLLKLLSPHDNVRRRVVEVCTHIQSRLVSSSVRVPVRKLLNQLKEHCANNLLALYDKRLLERGITRLTASELSELLPDLISTIIDDPANGQAEVLHFLLLSLHHYRLPPKGSPEDKDLRQRLGLHVGIAGRLSTLFGKLILLNVDRDGQAVHSPGLLPEDSSFLTLQGRNEAWDPKSEIGLSLSVAKKDVLDFLDSGAFLEAEKFLPALYASASQNSSIAGRGEDILRHMHIDSMLDKPEVVPELYRLYVSVSPELKIRILTYLTRSQHIATFPTESVAIIVEAFEETPIETNEAFRSGHQPSAGRVLRKLRKEVFAFANHFIRIAKPEAAVLLSESIIPILHKFITNQGWPTANAMQDLGLRCQAYELLGRTLKSTKKPKLDTLDFFFGSLRDDMSGPEVTLSIEEGIAALIGIYSSEPCNALQAELEQKLLRYMVFETAGEASDNRRRTQYTAVRFANRTLPFSNITARWINILAVASQNGEVAEEGKRGLDPLWFKTVNSEQPWLWKKAPLDSEDDSVLFPQLPDIVNATFGSSSRDEDLGLHGSEERGITPILQQRVAGFTRNYPQALGPTVEFCHLILLQSALEFPISVDWSRSLRAAVERNISTRRKVLSFFRVMEPSTFDTMRSLLLAALEAITISGCEDIFLSLVTVSRHLHGLMNRRFGELYTGLHPTLVATSPSLRRSGARAFGILFALAYSTRQEEQGKVLRKLFDEVEGIGTSTGPKTIEIDGKLRAIAFALARIRLNTGFIPNGLDFALLELCLHACKGFNVSGVPPALFYAVCAALEQFGTFIRASKNATTESSALPDIDLRFLVETVMHWARQGDEQAIRAIGRFSVCLPEDGLLEYIDDQIHSFHDLRQPEAHFIVGESLACVAAGWDCAALELDIDIGSTQPTSPSRKITLPKVLERTIKDCTASKTSLRKASVIWLLSLMNYCGHLPLVRSWLSQVQAAFKSCLRDRDHLIQEAAARGLGLVYDQADGELKEEVVNDLMTGKSQPFEAGASSTDESFASPYAAVLNLASEIGEPSLTYRFMTLASHDTIWSSQAALGRFELNAIFADSSINLHKTSNLYAKLFRYRFLPNSAVREAMNSLWNALVKDQNALLDAQFESIMEDLLKNILSREWRVREASCLAMADLIQGHGRSRFETFERWPEVWEKCFKVLDDMKSSVTVAAASLAKVLINILIQSLDAGESWDKTAAAMLKHVLPFLQSYGGVGAKSESVRAIAISTLIEIVRKGSSNNRKVLRPHLPQLLELLIPLLDVAEEGVEYIRLNASNYNMSEQDIDDIRLSHVRASPIMEAIERCLDLLDEDSVKDMVVTLENLIKTAISLPSKVGCSRILVSMATRRRGLMEPYAGQFLRLIEKAAMDRNESVSTAFAVASGYLARLADDREILQLVEFTKRLYATTENEKHRSLAGEFIGSISKYASDRFNALSSKTMPLVYVAMHDESIAVKTLYRRVWEDHVAGARAVNLYLKEIVDLADEWLNSPRWGIKHAAARTIADATTTLAANVDSFSIQIAEILWPALEKAVGGKSWDGKENVVLAFAAFVEKVPSFWRNKPAVASEITKITLREARRQNLAYQQHALQTLGRVAAARTDIDMVQQCLDIVTSVVERLTDADGDTAMDIDGDNAKVDDGLRDRVLIAAVQVQKSVRSGMLHNAGVIDLAIAFTELWAQANTVRSAAVSVAIWENLEDFFGKIDFAVTAKDVGAEAKVRRALQTLLFQQVFTSYAEAARLKRANAVVALANVRWDALKDNELKAMLGKEIEAERVTSVQDKLKEAYSILNR